MLRRVTASLILARQRPQVMAPVMLTASSRSCATANASDARRGYASGAGGNPMQRARATFNNNNNNNNTRRAPRVLPPAFDIVHWNDEDISAGHLLRVIHQDSAIVLDYHKQNAKVRPTEPAGGSDAEGVAEDGEAQQQPPQRRRGGHAERVVTVTLPPVYIARFLGVLEGRAEKVDVQSRFTNATFTKKSGTSEAEKRYVLSCHSRRPSSGQRQTAEGNDIEEESVEWTVEMDAAESLMLHRFLTQALQYNTGFARRV